jgi:hypothetical protein
MATAAKREAEQLRPPPRFSEGRQLRNVGDKVWGKSKLLKKVERAYQYMIRELEPEGFSTLITRAIKDVLSKLSDNNATKLAVENMPGYSDSRYLFFWLRTNVNQRLLYDTLDSSDTTTEEKGNSLATDLDTSLWNFLKKPLPVPAGRPIAALFCFWQLRQSYLEVFPTVFKNSVKMKASRALFGFVNTCSANDAGLLGFEDAKRLFDDRHGKAKELIDREFKEDKEISSMLLRFWEVAEGHIKALPAEFESPGLATEVILAATPSRQLRHGTLTPGSRWVPDEDALTEDAFGDARNPLNFMKKQVAVLKSVVEQFFPSWNAAIFSTCTLCLGRANSLSTHASALGEKCDYVSLLCKDSADVAAVQVVLGVVAESVRVWEAIGAEPLDDVPGPDREALVGFYGFWLLRKSMILVYQGNSAEARAAQAGLNAFYEAHASNQCLSMLSGTYGWFKDGMESLPDSLDLDADPSSAATARRRLLHDSITSEEVKEEVKKEVNGGGKMLALSFCLKSRERSDAFCENDTMKKNSFNGFR